MTEGRRREFRHFLAFVDPEAREKIPDPQAARTFEASRLDWSERDREPHASLLRLYRALLALRRHEPALQTNLAGKHEAVALDDDTLMLSRWDGDSHFLVLACLRGAGTIDLHESRGGLATRSDALASRTHHRGCRVRDGCHGSGGRSRRSPARGPICPARGGLAEVGPRGWSGEGRP